MESLDKDMHSLENIFNSSMNNGEKMKWFVSFGSLLYLIRDKKLNKTFNQDIDISIIGTHSFTRIFEGLTNENFHFIKKIINPLTKKPLYAEFKSPNGLCIDLFFWLEVDEKMWHTYDYMNEKQDIPSNYHFKSVPSWMMEGSVYKYEWKVEEIFLNIPHRYGTLLDYWYPNWFIPDNEFGVSLSRDIREFDNKKFNLSKLK